MPSVSGCSCLPTVSEVATVSQIDVNSEDSESDLPGVLNDLMEGILSLERLDLMTTICK
jgi:hypothetical protein